MEHSAVPRSQQKQIQQDQRCTRRSTASMRAADNGEVWFHVLLLPSQPQLFDSPAAAQKCPKAINHLCFVRGDAWGRWIFQSADWLSRVFTSGCLTSPSSAASCPLSRCSLWLSTVGAQGCRVRSPVGCHLNVREREREKLDLWFGIGSQHCLWLVPLIGNKLPMPSHDLHL